MGELTQGDVRLLARGKGGLVFDNSTALDYNPKNVSLLIQTDKAQYKPGQTVLMRVFALDPELRPTLDQPLHIYVTVRRIIESMSNRCRIDVEIDISSTLRQK